MLKKNYIKNKTLAQTVLVGFCRSSYARRTYFVFGRRYELRDTSIRNT
jgi:hypothetical protein